MTEVTGNLRCCIDAASFERASVSSHRSAILQLVASFKRRCFCGQLHCGVITSTALCKIDQLERVDNSS